MSVVVAGASAVGRSSAGSAQGGATAVSWTQEHRPSGATALGSSDVSGVVEMSRPVVVPADVRVDLRRLQSTPTVRVTSGPAVPSVGPGSTDLSQVLPVIATAQLMLREVDPSLLADGVLGPRTRAAVLDFQRTHERPATGAIGQDDWRLLCTRNTLAIGCTGHGVQACQWLLSHLPDVEPMEMDGVFGTGTYMTVRDVQRRLGMVEDGVVDVGLWFRLLSASA